MFGPAYFGQSFYGPTYYPPGGDVVVVEEPTGTGLRGGAVFIGYQQALIARRIKEELAKARDREIDEIKGTVSDGAVQIEAVSRGTIEQVTETIVQEFDFTEMDEYSEDELEIQLRAFIESYIQELLDEEAVILMMFLM